jgi:hypothetical protein
MKSEDLIKKLEDTKPPDAELPGYKEQLKMALLEGAYPVRGKGRGITGLLKDTFTPKRKVCRHADDCPDSKPGGGATTILEGR